MKQRLRVMIERMREEETFMLTAIAERDRISEQLNEENVKKLNSLNIVLEAKSDV